MSNPNKWTSVADFLFGMPLYEEIDLSKEWGEIRELFVDEVRFDAHCPFCNRASTFNRTAGHFYGGEFSEKNTRRPNFYDSLTVTCARNDNHGVHFYVLISANRIRKVGQFPSFADIANDESKKYRSILGKADGAELHKAIGLAAHGVGIGAFVYLRRIFERLVQSRLDEFKEAQGWDDTEFTNKRMNEKIELLKDHLPNFMVKNSKLYSILSSGIHQLTEQECLGVFDAIKKSVFFILDEDIKKREEMEARKEVEKAIATFTDPASGTPTKKAKSSSHQ